MDSIKLCLLFLCLVTWISSGHSLLTYCKSCTEWDEKNALCIYCCNNVYECCSKPGKNVEDCKLLPCPCGSPTTTGEPTTEATTTASTPEATTPEATTPEATTPEATTPEATTPEATTPEATTPEATTPEATTPEATTPEATTPEATTPEATTPEATTPEATTPEATTPEATTPEATTPEATTPEATTPEATTPEATTPEATSPEATTPEATTPEATTPAVPRQCALPVDNRILNGRASDVCKRPWMVRIVAVISLALPPGSLPMPPLESTLCNAVLISATQILTTSFCAELIENVTATEHIDMSVKLNFGDTDTTAQEETQMYRTIKETQTEGEVAVITLSRAIPTGDDFCIRPVCLPDNSTVFTEDDTQDCKLAAWGATEKGGEPGTVINEADVNLMPSDNCKTALNILVELGYPGVKEAPEGAICTSAPGTAGTCQGDQGGVLICKDGGEKTQENWILAGLAWDTPCNAKLPSTFINVMKYVNSGFVKVPEE